MVIQQLREAIETLSLLRLRVLHADPDNPDLRSAFREISYHLESIQQQKPVSFEEFRQLVSWLSGFLDAEFGGRLRQFSQLKDSEFNSLADHIHQRKATLMQAENDVPQTQAALTSCLTTLNVEVDPEQQIGQQARLLARSLKNHLQDDAELRKAMHSLIAAMQNSLEEISGTLGNMQEEIPELAETQGLLQMDLPDDPREAHALLQKARDSIMLAGQKVGRAGKAISQALESQKAQLQTLNESLNRAEFEAQHDALTGLGNRRKLAAFFKAMGDRPATFLIIDIDHFKRINDRYGHDAGDEILASVARILHANVRASDLVVRLGGEEFATVLPGVNPDDAMTVAENLRGAIEAGSIKCSKGKIHVTVSIGLATRRPGEAIGHWIGRGDKALYEAKNNGRNRTEIAASH